MKMVKNPISNWKEMKGRTELEQYFNAVISSQFISDLEVPDDECFELAKLFCNEKMSVDQIGFILYFNFNTGTDNSGNTILTHVNSTNMIDRMAKRLYDLSEKYKQYSEDL